MCCVMCTAAKQCNQLLKALMVLTRSACALENLKCLTHPSCTGNATVCAFRAANLAVCINIHLAFVDCQACFLKLRLTSLRCVAPRLSCATLLQGMERWGSVGPSVTHTAKHRPRPPAKRAPWGTIPRTVLLLFLICTCSPQCRYCFFKTFLYATGQMAYRTYILQVDGLPDYFACCWTDK